MTIICDLGVAIIDKDLSITFIGCDFAFALIISGAIWETRKDCKMENTGN